MLKYWYLKRKKSKYEKDPFLDDDHCAYVESLRL